MTACKKCQRPVADEVAIVISLEQDTVLCPSCWQQRSHEAFERYGDAWVVPNPEGGETGVLLRFGAPGRRHWYLICPAAATLYFEAEPEFDDCQIGMECDFLDTVHAEAARLATALCDIEPIGPAKAQPVLASDVEWRAGIDGEPIPLRCPELKAQVQS